MDAMATESAVTPRTAVVRPARALELQQTHRPGRGVAGHQDIARGAPSPDRALAGATVDEEPWHPSDQRRREPCSFN
jgi:hypothetical protein